VTRDPLTDEYLADCQRRARRYQGQWTGTGGSLAADVMRLLWEVARLKQLLAEHQAERDERYRPYWLEPHD
jgi:hypothetical protein